MATTLPTPDPIAQQHSDQLLTHIKQHISDAGGKITFADYMQHCLYTPSLGYYSAGSHKIGAQGDFITAPEISPLFSRCLAQHIHDVFIQLDQPNILEFGAGNGKMAIDILSELERKNSLPRHYFILEVSADLRKKQEEVMQNKLPHLLDRVIWLTKLPISFIGVVLANELCDAMPVHCIHFKEGKIQERYIEHHQDKLQWCEGALSSTVLTEHIDSLPDNIQNENIVTEINLAAKAWLASVAEHLQQGAVFIIDYGYSATEYYHPQRTDGTLMCYYQHQGHNNPLILQGLQDITAHIDFSSLAHTAVNSGLDVAGFQSQADFLLAGGITKLILETASTSDHLNYASEIKQLTLPSAMGESFKVLTLTKGLDELLSKIQLADRRYSL